MAYNRKKIENWIKIQEEQLNIHLFELKAEYDDALAQAYLSTNFYEKIDLKKAAGTKMQELMKFQEKFHEKVTEIHKEAEREIAAFDDQLSIEPILLIKIVLKF